MKTICMLSNLFPPIATGSSTQCYALARELVKQGYKVIVITAQLSSNCSINEIVDGIVIYRLPAIRLPKLSIALNFNWLSLTMLPSNRLKMKDIIKDHQVDILHVHNHMFDMALNGAKLARDLQIPLVLTMHTVIKHANPLFNLILYPLDRFFLKHKVLNKVHAVICPDYNINRYVRGRFNKNDAVVIPYGIDLPEQPSLEIASELSQMYGLEGNRLILSLGHVNALRNRIDLIKALPEVIEKIPQLILLIVGSIDDNRPVKLVQRLGLEKNVIFTGAQPHSLIPAFHSLAELEAMWLEQTRDGMHSPGIACMEAMYCGKVVLTVSNKNIFGEGVLENGKNVILFEDVKPALISQIICQLLENPKTIQDISESARETAYEFFSWNKVVKKTINIYSETITKYKNNMGNGVSK